MSRRLVLYSSSESDDDEEEKKKNRKRLKLPPVNLQIQNEVDLDEKQPETNTDRIRSFPHERGNWALSIYAFVNCSSHLDTMIDDLMELFDENHWKRLTELHISLSKTFPVRFHHIESIRQGMEHEFSLEKSAFSTRIENVTILNSDDGLTSFLVFTLDRYQEFSKLIGTVDQVLHTHRYPGYYENPCFHVSFAYSTAVNREEKLPKDWQEKVQGIIKQYQCQPSALTIPIDDIRLKAGKRVYYLTKTSS